jgi:hypothetical protein
MSRKRKTAFEKAREAYVELNATERATFRQIIELAEELGNLPPVGTRRQRTARPQRVPDTEETKAE